MAKQLLPRALTTLIDELGNLPGVGVRTAERYAYHLLRTKAESNKRLSNSIANLKANVKYCPATFALIDADEEISPLYTDETRNKKLIAVVEEPLDIIALEKTKHFNGTYHVLGGVISPINGITPDQLHIRELAERISKDEVQEIIIATNASVEGESTALYIQNYLREKGFENLVISRLARGLPVGVDLEYADQITLSHALEGRKAI